MASPTLTARILHYVFVAGALKATTATTFRDKVYGFRYDEAKVPLFSAPNDELAEFLGSLSTLVASNRRCASACAVVFLSGRNKYLAPGAAVGLHSASFADGRADPEATELMAAYLRQLGVPATTLRNMARTAPNKIRWLTRAEQKAIGIRDYAQVR